MKRKFGQVVVTRFPKRVRLTAAAKYNRSNRTLSRTSSRRGSIRQQVGSIHKALRTIAPEVKYLDVAVSSTNIATPGAIVHCTAIAQGDLLGNRTGEGIKLQSISLHGSWTMPVATTPTANAYIRVVIFVDKQQVADTTPGVTTVFSPTGPQEMQLNTTALKRFRILYASPVLDLRRLAAATALSTTVVPTQSPLFSFDWSGNMEVRFNGANTTDIEKNGVYVAYLSDDANNTIDTSVTCRLGFIDS